MRQIKFRAWDKCAQKMWEPAIYQGVPYIVTPLGNFLRDDHNDPIMQYTGLSDKNGKEIYEGDVVQCANGHIGVIEWKQDDACFNVTGYYCGSNDYPTMAFMEGQPFLILGNIYENPELIKE